MAGVMVPGRHQIVECLACHKMTGEEDAGCSLCPLSIMNVRNCNVRMALFLYHPHHLTPAIPISFSSSSKHKKYLLSSSIVHTSMYNIYKLNVWLSDGYIGQLLVIISSKLVFIASVFLSLNDFDGSLLHCIVEFATSLRYLPHHREDLQLHWKFPFFTSYHHV